MAVTRNPKPVVLTPPIADEKEIEALINKGGSSSLIKATETKPKDDQDDDKIKPIPLRGYESLWREIDQFLLTIPKRNRPSRNAYILKAINAQIQRDKSKQK